LDLEEYLVRAVSEPNEKLKYFGAASFSGEIDDYTVLHNSAVSHSLPTLLSALDGARLAAHAPKQSIAASNHPWPLTSKQKVAFDIAAGLLVALLITMGFCFIPASFTAYIVMEREKKTLHQQLVSGVTVPAYFVANLLWDLLNYCVAMVLLIILFFAFERYAPAYIAHLDATILVFALYGLSSTTFAYAFSFLFSSYAASTVASLMTNIVAGLLFLITSFILGAVNDDTRAWNDVLLYFFYISPPFCLGKSLLAIFAYYAAETLGGQFGISVDSVESVVSLWSFKSVLNIATPILYMSISSVCFFLLALYMQYNAGSSPLETLKQCVQSTDSSLAPTSPSQDNEDVDVKAERRRVEGGGAARDIIQVQQLRKVYPPRGNVGPKVGVVNSSFAIKKGECFGLLGINGAGKTTTMAMLTGEFPPTSGKATLAGFDVATQRADVYRNLGFCPQFDALFEKLTAREHLEFYATIRGVPQAERKAVIDRIIADLDLGDYQNKTAGSYSGGNRRKLSVGIALIAEPQIIFLDEPSTGMDPVARRFMWGVIARTMSGRSVILTTHSMEECEALCQRIAIMVDGRMQCIGSSQHLKSRFGTGYTIEARALEGRPVEPIAEYITDKFEGATKLESQGGQLRYQVPLESVNGLAELFVLLEDIKIRLGIESYSVGQTTLEQVFLSKAAENIPED